MGTNSNILYKTWRLRCALYDSTVKISGTVTDGVWYGRVNCTQTILECGKSEEEECKNKYISE